MKFIDVKNISLINRILERRTERAFTYAIRKGISPVEYMRGTIDILIKHIFRRQFTQRPG